MVLAFHPTALVSNVHSSCIKCFSINTTDYISGPYSVTFPTGSTRVQFNISLNNDGLTERRELFNLTISDIPHPNITLGDIHQAVVSIVDNASM